MVLDISKLLSSDGSSIDISCDLSFDRVEFNGQNISFTSPMHLQGDIKNINGMLYLVLNGTASYTFECSRCLAPAESKLDFNIKEVFSKTELENENDDVIILSSNEIDLAEIAEQGFYCALPIAELCKETCRGLCPICGCNLNIETCGCDKDDIDPRLSALKDFLK